jgi:hypothetical protein
VFGEDRVGRVMDRCVAGIAEERVVVSASVRYIGRTRSIRVRVGTEKHGSCSMIAA